MSQPVERALRATSKAVFATADLFLGGWPGPRILIYHEINENPIREMDLSPEVFARQAQWLTSHGRVVGLEDAIANAGDPASSSAFVLTFDDGYGGLYRHAYPILRDSGLPFTLYLTSQLVEDRGGGLGWDEVNAMAESGLLTVGAHTHTHPDLRELSTEQVEHEISTSNGLIEERTGTKPLHFAYTKGYWAEAAEPVLRRHYATAVLGAGPPIDSTTDPLRLSRVPVQKSDGYFFFKRKMKRGLRMEEWARARLKGYKNPSPTVQ